MNLVSGQDSFELELVKYGRGISIGVLMFQYFLLVLGLENKPGLTRNGKRRFSWIRVLLTRFAYAVGSAGARRKTTPTGMY